MHKEPGEGPASVWQEDLASLYSSPSQVPKDAFLIPPLPWPPLWTLVLPSPTRGKAALSVPF